MPGRIAEAHLLDELLTAEDQAVSALTDALMYRELLCVALACWAEDRETLDRLRRFDRMTLDDVSRGRDDAA